MTETASIIINIF